MLAIFKRELKAYYNTMIGFVILAFMVAIIGVYFLVMNLTYGYPYFSYALYCITVVFMLLIPVLTMRSFAEDRRNKTDQLLMTVPVTTTQIVMGKFLAMAAVYLIPILIVCICPLIIEFYGTAYLLADYAAILAFFLMGCVYISIGMFISSLTDSQIISAVCSFGVMLLIQMWSSLISLIPTTAMASAIGYLIMITVVCVIFYAMTKNFAITAIAEVVGMAVVLGIYLIKSEWLENSLPNVLSALTITDIFTNFSYNYVFDVSGLVMYLSIIAVMIFATVQALQKRRWS